MGIVPLCVWGHFQSADNRARLVVRSEQPVLPEVIEERRNQLQRLQDQDYFPERIALRSRVLIIEGIPGSGKDTFQTYLKEKLKGRDLYDYSEGELKINARGGKETTDTLFCNKVPLSAWELTSVFSR